LLSSRNVYGVAAIFGLKGSDEKISSKSGRATPGDKNCLSQLQNPVDISSRQLQSQSMASKPKSSKKPSAAQLAARKKFAEMAKARAAGKSGASKRSTKMGGNKSAKRSSKRDVRDDKGSRGVPSLATKPISSPKGSGQSLDYHTGDRVNRPKAIQPKRVRNPYFGAIGTSSTQTPMFIDYWA